MKQRTSLLFLLCSLFCFDGIAQNTLHKKKLNENYSWINSSQNEFYKYYFEIDSLQLSKSKYHFRYKKSNQIIDLYSDNGIDFKGILINYIVENKPKKTYYGEESHAHSYLFEKNEISSSKATRAGLFILNKKIYSIPTDSLIKNWSFGWKDCGAIAFDFKVKTSLYHKYYTCAKNQKDSLDFVIDLKKTTEALEELLGLNKSFDLFQNKLPKRKSYLINNHILTFMTKKEVKDWIKEKPIRAYKKSIKDTIDNYLDLRLNELIPKSNSLNCYINHKLTFSKKGKLKKMDVNMGFWEKLTDNNYRRCKRIIKRAFREIELDFIDPKYEFKRTLCFGSEGIYIE